MFSEYFKDPNQRVGASCQQCMDSTLWNFKTGFCSVLMDVGLGLD